MPQTTLAEPGKKETMLREKLPFDYVKYADAKLASSVTADGYIKRPTNSFMLFRGYHMRLLPRDRRQYIPSQWHKLSREEKAPWEELGEYTKIKHRRLHPDYSYAPQKPKRHQDEVHVAEEALAEQVSAPHIQLSQGDDFTFASPPIALSHASDQLPIADYIKHLRAKFGAAAQSVLVQHDLRQTQALKAQRLEPHWKHAVVPNVHPASYVAMGWPVPMTVLTQSPLSPQGRVETTATGAAGTAASEEVTRASALGAADSSQFEESGSDIGDVSMEIRCEDSPADGTGACDSQEMSTDISPVATSSPAFVPQSPAPLSLSAVVQRHYFGATDTIAVQEEELGDAQMALAESLNAGTDNGDFLNHYSNTPYERLNVSAIAIPTAPAPGQPASLSWVSYLTHQQVLSEESAYTQQALDDAIALRPLFNNIFSQVELFAM